MCAINKCLLITSILRLGSEFFDWCVHGLSRYYTQEPVRHLWQPGMVLGIFRLLLDNMNLMVIMNE